jgi:hypothetical protein
MQLPQRHRRCVQGSHAVTDAWLVLAVPDDEVSEPCRAPLFPMERMFWPAATARPATKSAATSPVRMELYTVCGVCPSGWPHNAAIRQCLVLQLIKSHWLVCMLPGCRSGTRLDVPVKSRVWKIAHHQAKHAHNIRSEIYRLFRKT